MDHGYHSDLYVLPAEFFDYIRQQNPAPLEPVVERYLQMLKPSQITAYTGNVKVVEGDVGPAERQHDQRPSRSA